MMQQDAVNPDRPAEPTHFNDLQSESSPLPDGIEHSLRYLCGLGLFPFIRQLCPAERSRHGRSRRRPGRHVEI